MENVTCFQSSSLNAVKHGFFGRRGGVSKGLVASLNCYPSIRGQAQLIDDLYNVQANRQLILNHLNIIAPDVTMANQVHGDNITIIKQHMPMDFSEADGLITDVPNIPIGILTADCVPVLYRDIHNKVIGAAHAGWKGAFLDIHLKMITKFNEVGILTQHINVAIGPSIQHASYEVDQSFYDRFVSKNDRYQYYFYSSDKEHHYQFDLPRLVYEDLMQANVHSVDWVRLDTVIHSQLFFSHRRATLNGTLITGRQLSMICL